MPRAFDEKDKQAIRTALMQAGRSRFAKSGVRAARVEDFCQDAGIAKGSFYGFFASKEDLFMAIANEQDLMHKRDIASLFEQSGGREALELLNEFFDLMMQRIETDPVLAIVRDTGEMSALLRKVSPHLLAENAERDRAFLVQTAQILQEKFGLKGVTAELLEHFVTLMLTLGLQKEFVSGQADYAGSVGLLRTLFVDQLLKERMA